MALKYIYETNKTDKARYIFGIEGENPLIVLGINPSQARPSRWDATIRKVNGFAQMHGFDAWIMLNLYPQRATDPDFLHKRRYQPWYQENLARVGKVLEEYPDAPIWAAWGNLIQHRGYLPLALSELKGFIPPEREWLRIGEFTKGGHPRHPSRMAYKETRHSFNIDAYLQQQGY